MNGKKKRGEKMRMRRRRRKTKRQEKEKKTDVLTFMRVVTALSDTAAAAAAVQ